MSRMISSRYWALCLVGLALVLLFLPSNASAQQTGGLPALERRVAALEALNQSQTQKIAQLEAALAAEQTARRAADAALANRAAALEDKTQFLSVVGTETFFTGTNLHLVNGLGSTNGNPAKPFDEFLSRTPATQTNGLGNLIVGYNEVLGASVQRGGSHNIVVGIGNDYPSIGGLVAGASNTIGAPYASISGGSKNLASGLIASVSGGIDNVASGIVASVSGGTDNRASGVYSSVSGGYLNTASGDNSSISGGNQNTASGRFASISGGALNSAGGFWAVSISGGYQRSASGDFDWVAGGLFQDL